MTEQEKIEFEKYKIFIESAEKNSEKRISQNNIYLTINLAFLSYILTQSFELIICVIANLVGIFICILWFLTIGNYSKRNKAKFEIINASPYGSLYEEEYKRIALLTSLSCFEQLTAIIFGILYIALLIINII